MEKEQSILEGLNLSRLYISFPITKFAGYCDYCFDNIEDHDETGLDCGGPNCPACIGKYSFFDWLIYAIIASWVIFFILIFIYYRTREKTTRERLSEEIETLTHIFKPVSAEKAHIREKKLESKIIGCFKRIFAIPFKITIRKPRYEEISPIPVKVPAKSPDELLLEKLKKRLALWKKEGYYGTVELEEKIERLVFKIRKREQSLFKRITNVFIPRIRAEKTERKRKKKIIKKRIKTLKREVRNRKVAGFLNKLGVWKKQGYYGTEEIKDEIKRLKEESRKI